MAGQRDRDPCRVGHRLAACAARSDNPWIGTLSAAGKRLQVATPVAGFAFQIEGDRMTGCGSGHTADGSSYTALCFDMIAMK